MKNVPLSIATTESPEMDSKTSVVVSYLQLLKLSIHLHLTLSRWNFNLCLSSPSA